MTDKNGIDVGGLTLGLGRQMVRLGGEPVKVANAIALGLGQFLAEHFGPEQAATILRRQAGQIAPPARVDTTPDEQEMLDLEAQTRTWIDGLVLSGVAERHAITAIVSACALRVARENGAAAMAGWLDGLAAGARANASAIDAVAAQS